MQSSHNVTDTSTNSPIAQKYHNISKNAIKSQHVEPTIFPTLAQKYHNISKNAIKSQLKYESKRNFNSAKIPQYFKECNQVTTYPSRFKIINGAKIPQYFKECNQVTTPYQFGMQRRSAKIPQYFKECNQVTTRIINEKTLIMRKNTTIFQRMQSSHNYFSNPYNFFLAQKYHNISKNAIKSQHAISRHIIDFCAKIPQYFKECNQVTTVSLEDVWPLGAKIPQYFKECNQVTTSSPFA